MSENEISQLKNAFNSELAKRDLELARQKELYQRLLSDSMSANASSKAPMQNESSDNNQSFRNEVMKAIENVSAVQNQWQARATGIMMSLSNRLDHQEAYSRLNSLLLHGLLNIPVFSKDDKGQDLKFCRWVKEALNDLFEKELDFTLHTDDIDTAHILRTKKGTSKVVIVKFVRRSIRNLYWYGKYALKNTGISLTEHLTAKNLELLRAAKTAVGEKCVWTNQCTVYVQANEVKRRIFSKQDLIEHTGITEINISDPFAGLNVISNEHSPAVISNPQISPNPDTAKHQPQQFIPSAHSSAAIQPTNFNNNAYIQYSDTDFNHQYNSTYNHQYNSNSFPARGYISHRGRGRGSHQNNGPRGYYKKRR